MEETNELDLKVYNDGQRIWATAIEGLKNRMKAMEETVTVDKAFLKTAELEFERAGSG